MNTIVPYGAKRTFRAMIPYIRKSAGMINRSPYVRKFAARTISRAWRGYKKSRRGKRKQSPRTMIGEKVGTTVCRHCITASTMENAAWRTLYSRDVSDISEGLGENQRNRDIANVRGFKICMELRNIHTDPIYVNIAVLSPKAGADISPTLFFRGHGDGRGVNFDDNTLKSVDFHCRPINVDRFTLLSHTRLKLGSNTNLNSSWNDGTKSSYRNFNKYVALKRQLRYNALSTAAQNPVFLVWWCDGWSHDSAAEIPPGDPVEEPVEILNLQLRVVTYFRDSKN